MSHFMEVSATSAGGCGTGLGGPDEADELFQPTEWDTEVYGVGVPSIDNQHKHLIDILNQLCVVAVATDPARARTAAAADLHYARATDSAPRYYAYSGTGTTAAAKSSTSAPPSTAETMPTQVGGTAEPPKDSGLLVLNAMTAANAPASLASRGFPLDLQRNGAIAPHIDALVSYCLRRLAAEDMALEALGYHDRAAHAQEHQLLVREVWRAQRLMEQCNMERRDLARLVRFLKAWLQLHIPRDRRYAPLVAERAEFAVAE